jgi:hypothetical protein
MQPTMYSAGRERREIRSLGQVLGCCSANEMEDRVYKCERSISSSVLLQEALNAHDCTDRLAGPSLLLPNLERVLAQVKPVLLLHSQTKPNRTALRRVPDVVAKVVTPK